MKFSLGYLKGQATAFLQPYKDKDPAAYSAAQQAIGGLLIFDGFFGMPHPFNPGEKRPGVFGAFGGIFVGLIFIFIPMIFNNLSGLNKLTATTSGTVVSVSQPETSGSGHGGSSCSATVSYTVNGQQYTKPTSGSSSSNCGLSQGGSVTVYYNPSQPGSMDTTNPKTIGLFLDLFVVAGVIAMISSLVLFIIRLLSIIFGWKLLKSGRALAKTLPPGTNLSGTIEEVKTAFKSTIFGFPAAGAAMPVNPLANPLAAAEAVMMGQQPVQPAQPIVAPTPVAPTQPPAPAAPVQPAPQAFEQPPTEPRPPEQ